MNQAPENDPASEPAVDSYKFGKEYEVPHPRTKAFMVEDAQWDRIKGRVSSLDGRAGIDWLLALATMVGGISASAGLALLALPKATKKGGELAPFVRPTLWAVLIAGALVAIAMVGLWRHFKNDEARTASDICAEMNTIQEAWKERKGSAPASETD